MKQVFGGRLQPLMSITTFSLRWADRSTHRPTTGLLELLWADRILESKEDITHY